MGKVRFIDAEISNIIAELLIKIDHKTLVKWATDCAENVIPLFEERYHDDNRPRLAIHAGRAWVRGDIKMSEARAAAFLSHVAARESDNEAACYCARAAGHAAATAHVAGHAIHAATYAAKAVFYATESNDSTFKEREWQYCHLLEMMERE